MIVVETARHRVGAIVLRHPAAAEVTILLERTKDATVTMIDVTVTAREAPTTVTASVTVTVMTATGAMMTEKMVPMAMTGKVSR